MWRVAKFAAAAQYAGVFVQRAHSLFSRGRGRGGIGRERADQIFLILILPFALGQVQSREGGANIAGTPG
jgi:hypothetical protein